MKITAAISRNILLFSRPLKAERLEPRQRALNRFQNCIITKTLKKIDSSRGLSRASPGLVLCFIKNSMPIKTARNAAAVFKIKPVMTGVTMKSLLFRGCRSITSGCGGSVDSASAAKVSMIRLTHNI